MGQCLLFFPILRTRSARKKLVLGSVIVLLGGAGVGCEDDVARAALERARSLEDRPPEERAAAAGNRGAPSELRTELARRAAKELADLEVEAGIESRRDPTAPGGDLARDIDAFTTLDACVRAHRVTDPILADAIDSLGYDTLVRDACRTVQALKSKDAKLCLPVAASALRQRCEAQVAILVGEPALCPVAGGRSVGQARDPVCLARASRDERLCAAALPTDRTTCAALVAGNTSACGGDEGCIRQVERFRGLLEKPASHSPFPARLHVEFEGEGSKSEKLEGSFDLYDMAAAGAVARNSGDKVRIVIGTPRSSLWPSWDARGATPQLFLALTLPAKMPTAGVKDPDRGAGASLGSADLSFDLLIPQVALLAGTMATERRVVYESVSAAPGSPVHLTFATKVNDAGRTFRIRIDLETFVRDGADPRPGVRSR